MEEEDVGVRPPDAQGTKELHCTQCNSSVIRLA